MGCKTGPAPGHWPGLTGAGWGEAGAGLDGGVMQILPMRKRPCGAGVGGGAGGGGFTQFLMASNVASQVWYILPLVGGFGAGGRYHSGAANAGTSRPTPAATNRFTRRANAAAPTGQSAVSTVPSAR